MTCLPTFQINHPVELPVPPPAMAGVSGGGGAANWSEIQGKPSTFPPSSHAHVIADVTGLQTSLDGKAEYTHTHPSLQISDSTAAGRALLTAADAVAQRAALNVEDGATANSQDAILVDRANHTGVQAQSTITGLVIDLAAKAPSSGATLTGATVNGVTLTTGGGTTNFLREDGTYAAPPGGESAHFVVAVTVPAVSLGYAEVVVADAGVTALSVIKADFVGELDAENDIESLADNNMRVWPVAEDGQVRMVLTANGAFVGPYKIKYEVAA